ALHANPCDLGHDTDKIYIKHHPTKSISFSAMAVGYALPNGNSIGGPLIGVGRYIAQGLSNLDKETGEGSPALDWTFGAHGMIVEVNEETGEYRVLKVASVYDVGRAVNPDIVRGQAIGGMIQGLGTAICEGYIYDQQGRLLNPSFTDNKIPTSKDLPMEIECAVVETPQIDGPYGARGVGEHSMISVAPALGNAIQKATGAEITHMPMRFEDVWRAIRKKEPIDNWITKSPVGSCRSAPELRKHI
ncbi:MAG: xanthine dehydrogenase family protein molybdopterin-binding subunit, partial [Spirochaetales bacterium]